MPLKSSAVLIAGSLAALIAAGCAGRQSQVDNGPSLYIAGEIAVREVGKPLRTLGFEWSRGNGYNGWEEKIELTDRRGMRVARLVSANDRVRISARNRPARETSLTAVFAEFLGAPLEPRVLAGWLKNRHHEQDGPLPDLFSYGDLQIEVTGRHLDETPRELRLYRGDSIYALLIKDPDVSD